MAVTADVVYGEAPDETGAPEVLRLDLYDPTSVPGVRPALVVIHGGGFVQGDKSEPVYVQMARALAAEGLVVAVVDYRLRPDVYPDYPLAARDAQHDVQAAVRWLRAHAGDLRLDPARIAVTGHSAGAITALRVATHPQDPGASGTPGEPSDVAGALVVSGFLPGPVGSATPPVRMLHGTEDSLIPLAWAEDTCTRWVAAGGACTLESVAGGTHDATAFFDPAGAVVTSFLACTVGGAVAFADVEPGTALARTVSWATGRGVLNPSVSGPLEPGAVVTRRRLAARLWRWAGRPVSEPAPGGAPAAPAVEWVLAEGALYPRRDGTFGGARAVDRAAAALALWRLAGRPGAGAPPAVAGLDPAARHAPAVSWLLAHGGDALLVGGTFRPDAPLRRAQLLRLLRGVSAEPAAWGATGGLVGAC
ncbi:MAG: alpha/beta hydrolase [Acidimicrobiales bacterium]|nr:alpha/beta hydrolase [Acidimicrobiales bacterium]